MKKKILLVGGSGYIGSNIIPFLNSYEIYVYDRNRTSLSKNIMGYELGATDDDSLFCSYINQIKPDIVYYAVSCFSSKYNDKLAAKSIRTLMASIPKNTIVVYLGSSAVYGSMPYDVERIKETEVPRPLSDYGNFKLFEEDEFRAQMNLLSRKVIFTRIFNVIGPREPKRMVSGAFVRRLMENKSRIEVGNLTASRDFVDVRDIGKALADLAFRGTSGEVYNICSGKSIRINKILEKIIHNMQISPIVVADKDKLKDSDVPYLVGNNNKITETIKWEPKISLQQSINDLIDSIRNE